MVHVALIAESQRLQVFLNTYGIQTQTPQQVEPIQIWPQQELVKAYLHLGINDKLGLSGRPDRPIGCLGTSKVSLLECVRVSQRNSVLLTYQVHHISITDAAAVIRTNYGAVFVCAAVLHAALTRPITPGTRLYCGCFV
ncbi:phosphorylase b kinase regulatory subunit beta-like [Ascaphus truei]|uniref:phosphorylase b kinase regulatory subunit beta-like n=1 Tax=Ascaphus truei TaxID=8439 RepID=UPI003F5A7FD3